MRFVVLGPVTVSKDGRPAEGLAPRHRAVLAYLLLHAGTVISSERLIGAMWGMTAPDTARAQLHASIAAIRKALRTVESDELLATRGGGYVIDLEPGQLDLEEFTGLMATAADLAPQEAARQIRRALALWQGRALADVHADFAAQARARLEERRLSAIEQLADLELTWGGHKSVVEELAAQVAAHPLRERLARQLMLALHRCGRQGEALAVGRAFRTALAEEQGLDPSRDFQQLEQSILRDDPALDPPAAPGSGPEPAVHARPLSFLPFDVPDFTGRSGELDRLAEAWSAGGGVVTISAIDGMAGIGKTALAVHAAHRLAHRFPDGQLFVDLHAHTPGQGPIEPGAALETLLRQLDLPAERIPHSLTERAALWRSELTDRRALIILDNAGDTEHVRPLLPGATHSLMLITSRRRLLDLDGADLVSLEVLPAEDAVALFTSIVGERARAEAVAVLDVLQLCGFLPLAVRIAAARLRHRPRWSVAYLAARLRDQRRRLSELATADRGMAAAFALSYEQLDVGQRRMFRLLGLHPGVDFDAHAAAAATALPVEETESLLEDLLDAHMLLQHEPGRYAFHDLLRDHAGAMAQADEPAEVRQAARARLFEHYLVRARGAGSFLPDAQAADETTFATGDEAVAWLTAEHDNLLAVARARMEPAGVGELANALSRYLYDYAYFSDARALHEHALKVCRGAGHVTGEIWALINLGAACHRQGDYDLAHDCAAAALRLSRQAGDRLNEARSRVDLGLVCWRLGRYAEAIDHYQQAAESARELGNSFGEAACLTNLGLIHERRGDLEQAAEQHRQALELSRKTGQRVIEANALDNLGLVEHRRGRFAQALDLHRQALDLFEALGDRGGRAEAHNGTGEAARMLGELSQAVDHHTTALALAAEMGSRPEQARGHHGLALAHRDLGHPGLAHAHAVQAGELFADLGTPEAEEVRALLAELGY